MNFNNRQDEHDLLSLLKREVPNDFNLGAVSRFVGDHRFREDFQSLCRFSGDARNLVNLLNNCIRPFQRDNENLTGRQEQQISRLDREITGLQDLLADANVRLQDQLTRQNSNATSRTIACLAYGPEAFQTKGSLVPNLGNAFPISQDENEDELLDDKKNKEQSSPLNSSFRVRAMLLNELNDANRKIKRLEERLQEVEM
ncbi:predicted protein [Chaetoceros tenuissimus]|uniref:Uncharacterized protein n=1 Tax=Chaetoceros tenuissimus TaxID=426638 RepID=A0AAD3HDB7_9STRA|nr:predicted protein [Chaetoceros tenuissimus]